MGHEGFYNSLLVAMGNVVSALLMYALQAAWLCQRLIDQDYRQNHGSRLTPISDGRADAKPLEIIMAPGDLALAADQSLAGVRGKSYRHGPRVHGKLERPGGRRRSPSGARRHGGRQHKTADRATTRTPYLSHSYLETALSLDRGTGFPDRVTGLRRAFSDINLGTVTWPDLERVDRNDSDHAAANAGDSCDRTPCDTFATNEGLVDETALPTMDKDFVSLIFTKGCVT